MRDDQVVGRGWRRPRQDVLVEKLNRRFATFSFDPFARERQHPLARINAVDFDPRMLS